MGSLMNGFLHLQTIYGIDFHTIKTVFMIGEEIQHRVLLYRGELGNIDLHIKAMAGIGTHGLLHGIGINLKTIVFIQTTLGHV